ncbi:hypothetical protein [Actinokineospora alba]|uniref:hypothetical protein n=1 Tax=Actinokineospora alba TaxID=504798 RepID=UPI000B84A243|nr:hypothetical protein [Actinokineospora alba]
MSKIGAENLQKTTKILESQSDGFHAASSAVRPVAENPPETGFFDDIKPWATDTPSESEQYEADSLNNIRVYEAYDHQSMAHDEALPMDYSYIQDPGGSIAIEPPGKTPPVEPGGGGDKDPYTPPGRIDEGRDEWTPPPVKPIEPVDPRPIEPVDPTKPQTDETRPNQHIQTKPDPVQVRPLPTDHPGPSNQNNNNNNNIYGPGGTGTGRGADGTGRGSGGPGGLRGGGGGGGGGAGGAGGSGMRGGGLGSGAGEHGAGGRSGALGAGGDHGPGGRGGAGAGGRGGGAGMGGGMGGGGKGQGGEDEEHTRASFLQEDDPEAIFGTDQITAPPVIGG